MSVRLHKSDVIQIRASKIALAKRNKNLSAPCSYLVRKSTCILKEGLLDTSNS